MCVYLLIVQATISALVEWGKKKKRIAYDLIDSVGRGEGWIELHYTYGVCTVQTEMGMNERLLYIQMGQTYKKCEDLR